MDDFAMGPSTEKILPLLLICAVFVISPSVKGGSVWTVTVGELNRETLVNRLIHSNISEEGGVKKEEESFHLLVKNSTQFQVSPMKQELDLVIVTADQLKLPVTKWGVSIPFDQFKEKVRQAGYELCPHDAAVLLVLSLHGSVEFTYVATEPIVGLVDHRPLIPVVFTYLGTPYIVMRPLDLVAPAPRQYFVVKPRKDLPRRE